MSCRSVFAISGILILGVVAATVTFRFTQGTRAEDPPNLVSASAETITQRALDYTRQHVHIKSGEPEVLLSRRVTPEDLNNLGLSVGNYAPDCFCPHHLVILKGDFDMNGAVPMSQDPELEDPAKYVAYIYDLRSGGLAAIGSDLYGSHYKKALGDPSLPDPSAPLSPPGPASQNLACEDVLAPGWETPPTQ